MWQRSQQRRHNFGQSEHLSGKQSRSLSQWLFTENNTTERYCINVGILQNRYNKAFFYGLIGIVGFDIFCRNSSSFSYNDYMYAVMKICILTYCGISGATFRKKTKQKQKNKMPL